MSDAETCRNESTSEAQAEKVTGTRKAASLMGYEGKPKALIWAENMIAIPDSGCLSKHGINLLNVLIQRT